MTIKRISLASLMLLLTFGLVVNAATVKGTLTSVKGDAIPLAKIFLKGADIPTVETVTDDKGAFVFQNVLPGEWQLSAEDGMYESLTIEIKIMNNESEPSYKIIAWQKLDLGKMQDDWAEIFEDLDNKSDEDLVEVFETIDKIIKEHPNYFPAYTLKGNLLNKQDKKEEAIPLFKKTLEINPYEPNANNVLALHFDDKKDYIKALEHYEMMLLVKPNDEKILHDIANKYYMIKKYKEAQKYYKSTIAAYENKKSAATAYFFLADTYLKTKEYEGALPYFEKFLELSPKHAYAKDAKRIVDALKKRYSKEKKNK